METNTTEEMLSDFMEPTESKGSETYFKEDESPVIIEPETVQVSPAETAPTKKPMLSADTMAEIYIGVADGAQTLIFNSINKKKLARRLGDRFPEAEKIINEIEVGRLHPKDLSPEQYALFMRVKSLLEIRETIPFSDEEYEKLKTPLTKIILDSGHDLPPGLALVLVGLEVMAPRMVDAIFE
jgi:hypothetical protein